MEEDNSVPLVVEPGKLESFLIMFDATVDDEGFIVDLDGNKIPTPEGEHVKFDEVGYIAHNDDEDSPHKIRPIKDHISNITSYFTRIED